MDLLQMCSYWLHKMVIGSNDGWYIDRKEVVFAHVNYSAQHQAKHEGRGAYVTQEHATLLPEAKENILFVYSFL